jgi:DNA repair protein RAD5
MRRDKRILSLPPLYSNLHPIELNESERHLYQQMQAEAVAVYQAWQQAYGPEKKQLWGNLLEALLRKRQVCIHSALLLPDINLDPLLQVYRLRCLAMRTVGCCLQRHSTALSKPVLGLLASLPLSWWGERADDPAAPRCTCGQAKVKLGFTNSVVCPAHLDQVPCLARDCHMCDRDKTAYKLLSCGHRVCANCHSKVKQCRLCAAFQRAGSLHSSKLDLFRKQLAAVPVGEKVVVFSQFTRVLKLLQVQVEIDGYSAQLFDGSLSLGARHQVLTRFAAEGGPRILLCQIVAGGLGLNLVCANHVFVMEPWWNPMVEKQAIDRTHRIGQQRAVHVNRYNALETVEQKVYEICDRKSSEAQFITRGDFELLPGTKAPPGLMAKLFEM